MTSDSVPKPILDLVVLDCPNALELATFYGAVLGWELEPGASERWANLAPPQGGVSPANPDGRVALAFQQIPDWVAPTWPGGAHPQQFHLDFAVPDIAAAEPAVLAEGARVHDHQPAEDGGFKVYLDPVGHPFCLCAPAPHNAGSPTDADLERHLAVDSARPSRPSADTLEPRH